MWRGPRVSAAAGLGRLRLQASEDGESDGSPRERRMLGGAVVREPI